MGSAPGKGGVVSDIIKSAADAVGNNKLRGNNTVVEALTLLFNFVFTHEIWPERWGEGAVVPLHKGGSRLDPANYRPITLMDVIGKLFGTVVNTRLQAFSEATDSVSDEQGGFRARRGTPDQIFLFREILASRRERGRPTYVTYIDVRKAYDTVWREQAYVRIHDAGVRGKLWRQLQAMHADLRRSVRHPLGESDPYDVERGVAQGAVESPWVYSALNFIDGLVQELKAAGLGIWIAGEQVPILLYADDMVLLAATQDELEKMMDIATDFAYRNRFEYNGDKSGVMAFNVTAAARAACKARDWRLSGEKVEVKSKYTYLGTVTQVDGSSWSDQINSAIKKAKRRSADLLWVCRSDRGIRPRTAVTLWQALVRPLLEYSSELWGGAVTKAQTKAAERVQMTFLRGTLGLHANGSGVANDIIRAETGCERLRDRWSKLQLGLWRRIFAAKSSRLLHKVAKFRWREESHPLNRAYGRQGWMSRAKAELSAHGLDAHWDEPGRAASTSALAWKTLVGKAVDATSDGAREARMLARPSTAMYCQVKDWDCNPLAYSFSSGEEDRIGQHVPERYLDDRLDLKGTRLKLLCRTGALPTMNRVGREVKPRKWPRSARICPACDSTEVEDVEHFVMQCPLYRAQRQVLISDATAALDRSTGSVDGAAFGALPPRAKLLVLLGRRVGDPVAENRIDRSMKRFLRKAWNRRAPYTEIVNQVLNTEYAVFINGIIKSNSALAVK